MTTDEMLRRIELAKMFVKDAYEALTPITDEFRWIDKNSPEAIIKVSASVQDLKTIKIRLGQALGSMNDDS